MEELVTPNHLGLGIRKKKERVASFAAEFLRNILSIHADRDRQDSLCLKFGLCSFDAS